MKIGIDCRTILNPGAGEKAGVGTFTYNLVKALVENYPQDLFVLFFEKSAREVAREFHYPHVEVKYLTLSGFKSFFPFLYSHYLVAEDFKKAGLNVLIAPANVLPLFYDGKSLLVVHDLAIYKNPEWFPSGQDFSTRVVVPSSVKRAAKIVAVSRATKKDLTEVFKIPANKIEVVYEGVDLAQYPYRPDRADMDQSSLRKFNITEPYVLFVGTLEPRKNLIRLIQAFSNSRELENSYQLVIAGGKGWKYENIFKAANKNPKIIFTDYISDQDKENLMRRAEVFVFPSLYEGFGLPVLEALACGMLVACSNNSSLPEVGGEAVKYFNAEDSDDIAAAVNELLNLSELEKNNLKERGRKWAEHFSWHRTAEDVRRQYLTV